MKTEEVWCGARVRIPLWLQECGGTKQPQRRSVRHTAARAPSPPECPGKCNSPAEPRHHRAKVPSNAGSPQYVFMNPSGQEVMSPLPVAKQSGSFPVFLRTGHLHGAQLQELIMCRGPALRFRITSQNNRQNNISE